MGAGGSRTCNFSSSTPAEPLVSPDATLLKLFVGYKRILQGTKPRIKVLDVEERPGHYAAAVAAADQAEGGFHQRRKKSHHATKRKSKKKKSKRSARRRASDQQDDLSNSDLSDAEGTEAPLHHDLSVDNDITSVVLTLRTSHPMSRVRVKGRGDAEVSAITLGEARGRGLAPTDEQLQPPSRTQPAGRAGDPPVVLPPQPAGEANCFRVSRIGESCEAEVTVTAEDGSELTYTVSFLRRPWLQTGYQPGTVLDKFRWYCHGAQDGIAVAQFALSLLYAGEDGEDRTGVQVPRGRAAATEADLEALENLLDLREEEDELAQQAMAADDAAGGSRRSGSPSAAAAGARQLVPLDPALGWVRHFRWLQRAAELGHVPAQQRLALMFAEGRVPREVLMEALEREEARRRQRGSGAGAGAGAGADRADSGDEADMEGTDTEDGAGAYELDPSQRMAFRWLLRAARAGDADSCRRLGIMYVEGRGVRMSYSLASAWLVRGGVAEADAKQDVSKRLEDLARQHNRRAAYQLGLACVHGDLMATDYVRAMHWFGRALGSARAGEERAAQLFEELASEPNQPAACLEMSRMHLDGIGREMDYKRALFWMERAGKNRDDSYRHVVERYSALAEQPDGQGAAYQMALLHIDGVGVHTDYKRALAWFDRAGCDRTEMADFAAKRFEQAAEKGNPRSAYQLALMYVDGVGVKMDYQQALRWMERAGEPPQEAHRQAAAWFNRSAADGDSRAAYQLALMYIDGVGVEHDYQRALEWLDKAGLGPDFASRFVVQRLEAPAERRDVPSCYQLGLMYWNYDKVLRWLVDEGHDEFYFHEHAARYFMVAAEEGHQESALRLANMYVEGQGLPINFKAATYWYEKAGKSKVYANKQRDRKLQSLKPHYRRLFKEYSERSAGGSIDLEQFAGFYRDCLMAKGIPKEKADQETRGQYQGHPKYETMFRSYDRNKDHSIDFDEVWSHPHTHTSLFPKTGLHAMAASAYFGNPHPLARNESLRHVQVPVETIDNSGTIVSARGSARDRESPRRPHTARSSSSRNADNMGRSRSSLNAGDDDADNDGQHRAGGADDGEDEEDEEEYSPEAERGKLFARGNSKRAARALSGSAAGAARPAAQQSRSKLVAPAASNAGDDEPDDGVGNENRDGQDSQDEDELDIRVF